jgi:tyrosyl-tRNA synthetase
MLHGRAEAERAAGAAKAAFEEGALSADLPTVEIDGALLDAGLGVLNAFVTAGLVASTSEARRQIKGGALRVNDDAVSDDKMVLTRAALNDGVVKLSMGKKKHVLLKV